MCKGEGHEEITTCPHELVDADAWRAIELAEFARRGHWPEAGGINDQPAAAVEAFRLIWREERACRAKLGIKGEDDG